MVVACTQLHARRVNFIYMITSIGALHERLGRYPRVRHALPKHPAGTHAYTHAHTQVGVFRRGKYVGGKKVGKGNVANVGDQVSVCWRCGCWLAGSHPSPILCHTKTGQHHWLHLCCTLLHSRIPAPEALM